MKLLASFLTALFAIALILPGCGSSDPEPAEKPDAPPAVDEIVTIGHNESIEASIRSAINFLKSVQNEDGSFGNPRFADVGITSLVVYSLATGPLADAPEAKEMIDRAVGYVTSHAKDNGSINNAERALATYRTSLAMMALSSVDREKHDAIIVGGQKYLTSTQFDEARGFLPEDWQYGGWRYTDRERDIEAGKDEADPDMSNVHFVIQALRESGLPEDDAAFKRAIHFLQRSQNRSESNDLPTSGDDGGGIYAPTESKAGVITLEDGTEVFRSYGSMTYALLKSYIFVGLPKDDPRVKAAFQWITENYTVDENPYMGLQGLFYYYMTMAHCLNVYDIDTIVTPDGREHDWREDMAAKLISLQKEDGTWTNEADRWMEGDPSLVTGYALTVLNFCYKQ